ncbi:hypothetical protein HK44_020495 [Pseudomonas fluorescens HK44]|uniref:Uncharacterized protein n=1 Tax=Pseudomonas fluorescens HK44 TaxID=1042209 RepID=A0A010T036_PSEFL|nr:hypothetical protein HK44_020495 [Pseudomonas fluorescens HK44]
MSEPVNYPKVWREHTGLSDSEQNLGVIKSAVIKAIPGYLLFCFCEMQREAQATFWEPMDGNKPVSAYLIKKHHWHPDQVSALSNELLLLVLHDELLHLQGSPMYDPVQKDIDFLEGRGVHI